MPRRWSPLLSLAAAAAAAAAACGAAPVAQPPATQPASQPASQPIVNVPPPQGEPLPRRVRITIVSASIDGHRPDGTPWDGSSEPPLSLDGPFARWLTEHPEIDGTEHLLGEQVYTPGALMGAKWGPSPDMIAFADVGGHVFRTPMAAAQFQAAWRFPFDVDVAGAGGVIQLTVVDWDGPGQLEVAGATVVKLSDLWATRVLAVPRFGSVQRVLLTIAAAPPAAPTRRVAVLGRDTWTRTQIELVAGQEVIVRATGEVCTKGQDRSRCAGPEGQPRPSDDNVGGFETRGHGALIGSIADTRFLIGRERRFVAPSSGTLLLGINDRDTQNNSGGFEVAVEQR